MEKSGVYRIAVKHIGYAFYETTDIWGQVKYHKMLLEEGKHYNVKLQECYSNLGQKYFKYEILGRTDNQVLRLMLWHSQNKTWPCNLNDYGPNTMYIHKDQIFQENYFSRTIYLERIPKTKLMFVCEKKNGRKLGIEVAMDNVRGGSYKVTDSGYLLPTHAPKSFTYRGAK